MGKIVRKSSIKNTDEHQVHITTKIASKLPFVELKILMGPPYKHLALLWLFDDKRNVLYNP
ncbi:MAG: hypothetical protein ACN6PN_02775, partial [Sphingobacterium sp.]